MMFVIPFLIAFLFAALLAWIFVFLIRKKKKFSGSSGKILKPTRMIRFGGIAMGVAFLLAIVIDRNLVITSEIFVLIMAILAVLIFGLWDDSIRVLNWKTQLIFQIALSVAIFLAGISIHLISNPITGGVISFESGFGWVASLILVVFWIILVINSINWMDGVDGLAGGISVIAALAIFVLTFKPEVNQPPLGIISIAFVGAVAGFLIFNFHPSRILAGTGGAYFMGLTLALMSISAGTKIATALLVLTLPVVDFLWVISERLRSGRSIFERDNNHLHHKLMKMGWSQKKISLYCYLFTAFMAIIALNTEASGKIMAFVGLAILVALSIIYIKKRNSSQAA